MPSGGALCALLSLSSSANLFGGARQPAGRRYVDDAAREPSPSPASQRAPLSPPLPVEESTAVIKRVSLARCNLIPQEVLVRAVRESGILGEPPKPAAIKDLSARLTQWYKANGYLFASVPSRLPLEGGHLVLLASEPKVAKQPVVIEFFSPMDAPPAPPVLDHGRFGMVRRSLAKASLAAALVPREPPVMRRRFRDKTAPTRIEAAITKARLEGASPEALQWAEQRLLSARKACGLPEQTQLELLVQRGELVPCSGTTRGEPVAKMLGLKPGQPWRFNQAGWKRLQRSGLFDVMDSPRIGPVAAQTSAGFASQAGRSDELVVRLQVVEHGAKKGKPARFRALEPSISLSRGRVTGEVSLEDSNWRGANQKLSARIEHANTSEVSMRLHVPAAFSVRRGSSRSRGGLLTVDDGGDGAVVSSDLRGFWRPRLAGAAPLHDSEPRAGVSWMLSGVNRALGGAVVGGRISADLVPNRLLDSDQPQASHAEPLDSLPVLLEGRLTAGTLRPGDALAEVEIVSGSPARQGRLAAGGELRLARAMPLADRCPDFWRISWRAAASAPLLAPPPASPPALSPAALLGGNAEKVTLAATEDGPATAWRGLFGTGGMPAAEAKRDPAPGGPSKMFNGSAARLAASEATGYVERLARLSKLSFIARGQMLTTGAPKYECESLGGDGSVRGYEPGELGTGLNTAMASISLTMPLPAFKSGGTAPPVSLVLFADAGARDWVITELHTGRSAQGTGASVGYGLRLGPIRFDVARNVRGESMTHVGLITELE